MYPFLFGSIPSFFFMIMVAAFATAYVATKFAEREGLSVVAVLDMSIIAVVTSILGGRLFHILVEAPDYYGIFWQNSFPWVALQPDLFVRMLYFWQGGFVSMGSYIMAIAGWVTYLKCRHLPMARYLDLGGLTAPVIIFFVRLGCLMAGCCYGKPTDFHIHLIFTNPSSTAYYYYPGIPLHATQLYAIIDAVVVFLLLWWIYAHRKFYGQVGSMFLIIYGLARMLIEEPLRGDVDRGVYWNGLLSTGQIVSAGFVVAGIIMYLWCRRHNRVPVAGTST